MKTLKQIFIVLIVAASSGSSGLAQGKPEDEIVLIGLDATKHSVSKTIPASMYLKNLSLAFGAVHDSILPLLDRYNENENPHPNSLHINSIGFGVGLSGQIGLGPIMKVTPAAQIRIVFTNSNEPIYPN